MTNDQMETKKADTEAPAKASATEEASSVETGKLSIRHELLKATGITPEDGESDARLIPRLCESATNDTDDDAWNDLSTDAQEFANLVNVSR